MNAETPFWKRKKLEEMSPDEWESLCDGCAQCCRIKLADMDSGDIYTTDVVCKLLNLETCRCGDYPHRAKLVPTCLILDSQRVRSLSWLPETCAYRLVAEGKDLYDWHPLISGDPNTVHTSGASVKGKVVSEEGMSDEDIQAHTPGWQIED
jgi:uncharacterized cysteine cluster protein YcgN (CxxCxxCC family)